MRNPLLGKNPRFHTSGRQLSREILRNQPLAQYEVDEETKELLQEVLGLAQRVVDLQYDDEIAEVLQDMLIDLSERFHIESQEVKVTVDEDGTITAKIEDPEPTQPLKDTRKGIKLVSDTGSNVVEIQPRPDTMKSGLPEGFHLVPDEPQSGPTQKNDND